MSEKKQETMPRFHEDADVDQAVKDAVHNALAEHARKGNKVVVWRDGRPVWVPATAPEPEA